MDTKGRENGGKIRLRWSKTGLECEHVMQSWEILEANNKVYRIETDNHPDQYWKYIGHWTWMKKNGGKNGGKIRLRWSKTGLECEHFMQSWEILEAIEFFYSY